MTRILQTARCLATASVLLLVIAMPAAAQMLCKERSEVLAQLSTGYKETPTAMGLASNGALIEVLTSSDNGSTWTMLITQPNGISCVMATGESWQVLEQVVMNTGPAS